MGDAAARIRMTEAEYLVFERASSQRHEYADGEIFAMAGGRGEHSAISASLAAELRLALRARNCRVFSSDMRVHIPASGRYVYPDASVSCGRTDYKDDARDTLLNPLVVVEVVSDSTEAYDRGDKFAHYRTIPSLKHYVIAAQDKPRIEVFTRQEDGAWLLRAYDAGENAALSALGCSLSVDMVYTNVFDEPNA